METIKERFIEYMNEYIQEYYEMNNVDIEEALDLIDADGDDYGPICDMGSIIFQENDFEDYHDCYWENDFYYESDFFTFGTRYKNEFSDEEYDYILDDANREYEARDEFEYRLFNYEDKPDYDRAWVFNHYAYLLIDEMGVNWRRNIYKSCLK
jgi:hypothetical protein